MMRIYINARFLTQRITGVQRYAIEISIKLKKLYPDIRFIAPQYIIHKELAKDLEVNRYGKLKGHLWEQIYLPIYLKQNNNLLLLNLANTAPLFYGKQIVTIHDLAFLRNPQWFSKRFYYYYKFLIPKITQKALIIITVSNFIKREIMEILNVPESKIKVSYGAVPEGFSVMPTNVENKYGDYILAVSSLDPRKNFKNLLLAFDKLALKNIKLVLVGSRNKIFSNQHLDRFSAKQNIIFTDYVPNEHLKYLYKNARLLVFPSLYEGFGLPPLEAMACGCPVVVSNVASLPEVCGDAAYYVDPYNIESIAQGMYEVLTDETLRQGLIQKGLERVKFFSWEKSAKEHIRIFEDILSS
jgi:glycosyltransferase involved in cell wall biosynthesis